MRVLAYCVSLHAKRALAEMLFGANDKACAEDDRTSPLVLGRALGGSAQAARKVTAESLWVHSFTTLLSDL